MRLQPNDLMVYAKAIKEYTNNQYEIIPTKGSLGYRKLEIKNNETWETGLIVGWLLLREAHEALRAINAAYRFMNK